jgi:EAL domain-containing protein (putative c-di-GMP-specific phosphodiesterase class I)
MNLTTLLDTLLGSGNSVLADNGLIRDNAVPSFWHRVALRRRAQRIEVALRASLAAGSFTLNYQPIFDQFGRIVEVEGLLRAQHPLLKSIGPSDYIPVAEERGLILPIGEQVLRMACDRLSEWRAAGLDGVHLAVNVSCIQMVSPNFAERVLEIFAEHQVPPGILHLELTETTLLRDTPPLVAQMRALAEAGVAFSIDDFGTGYSTLERLAKLPISTMKIDQSFVREIDYNNRALGIVRAMADLARHLHLDLIAEGVERTEQLEILNAIGCHKFQGYLLGRPMAAEQVLALMLDGKKKRLAEAERGDGPMLTPPPPMLPAMA